MRTIPATLRFPTWVASDVAAPRAHELAEEIREFLGSCRLTSQQIQRLEYLAAHLAEWGTSRRGVSMGEVPPDVETFYRNEFQALQGAVKKGAA